MARFVPATTTGFVTPTISLPDAPVARFVPLETQEEAGALRRQEAREARLEQADRNIAASAPVFMPFPVAGVPGAVLPVPRPVANLTPAAIRMVGATGGGIIAGAAGLPTGPGALATGAAGAAGGALAVEPLAQQVEMGLGLRQAPSVAEGAVNVIAAGVPAIPMRAATPFIGRIAGRAAEGALIGVGQEAATTAVRGEEQDPSRLLTAAGLGGTIGAGGGTVERIVLGPAQRAIQEPKPQPLANTAVSEASKVKQAGGAGLQATLNQTTNTPPPTPPPPAPRGLRQLADDAAFTPESDPTLLALGLRPNPLETSIRDASRAVEVGSDFRTRTTPPLSAEEAAYQQSLRQVEEARQRQLDIEVEQLTAENAFDQQARRIRQLEDDAERVALSNYEARTQQLVDELAEVEGVDRRVVLARRRGMEEDQFQPYLEREIAYRRDPLVADPARRIEALQAGLARSRERSFRQLTNAEIAASAAEASAPPPVDVVTPIDAAITQGPRAGDAPMALRQPEVTAAPAPAAQGQEFPRVDLERASVEDIYQWAADVRAYGRNIEDAIFGSAGGKRYRTLRSIRDGSFSTRAERDAAGAEMRQMESRITPEQNRILDGEVLPPNYIDPDEARRFARKASDIEFAENVAELGANNSLIVRSLFNAAPGQELGLIDSALAARLTAKARALGATQDELLAAALVYRVSQDGADAYELFGITQGQADALFERVRKSRSSSEPPPRQLTGPNDVEVLATPVEPKLPTAVEPAGLRQITDAQAPAAAPDIAPLQRRIESLQQRVSDSSLPAGERRAARAEMMRLIGQRRKSLRGDRPASGRANVAALANVAGPLVGGGVGSLVGETPEERLRNAAIGAALGSGIALTATRPSVGPRESLRQAGTGRDAVPQWYRTVRNTKPFKAFREAMVDYRTRVKETVAGVDQLAKVANEENPYLFGRLFLKRVAPRVEAAQKASREIEQQLDAAAKAGNYDPVEFGTRFREYQQAKHGPDYNAQVIREDGSPASGRTDEQWRQVILAARDEGLADVFEDIGRNQRQLIDQILDTLVDGRVISFEQYAALKERYPNYVPFNRIMTPGDPEVDVATDILGGRSGAQVLGTGIRKAKGSDLPIADINANILANLNDAVVRAERNRVALATLQFARKKAEELTKQGIGVRIRKLGPLEKLTPDKIVYAHEDGVPLAVEFQDPKLNVAFASLAGEPLGPVERFFGKITRFWSQIMTRFSPEFVISNPIRDRQELASVQFSNGDYSGGLQTLLNPKAIGEDFRDAILHYSGKEGPRAQLFQQFLMDGGATGGYGLSTRQQAADLLEQIRADVNAGRSVKDRIFAAVDFVNEVAENSTRYSAYRRALEQGATRDEAALAAADAGVDFNRKGKFTGNVGSFYAFLNPAIQGPVNSLRGFVRNPKALTGTMGALVGMGYAVDQWNMAQDPGWKDRPQLRQARIIGIPLLTGAKDANGDPLYIQIPIAQSLRPIKAFVDFGQDLATHQVKDTRDSIQRLTDVMVNSVNPLGSPDPATAIVPTIGRPIASIVRNETELGRRIYPERLADDENVPDVMKRFPSLQSTPQGKALTWLAESLYDITDKNVDVSPETLRFVLESYLGGPYRTAAGTASGVQKLATEGDTISPAELPVVRAFVKSIRGGAEEDNPADIRAAQQELKTSAEAMLRHQEAANVLVNQMKAATEDPAGWPAYLQQAQRDGRIPSDPVFAKALASALTREIQDKGRLDYMIGSMSVRDGQRARFYQQLLADMPPERRGPFIQSQVQAGLFTEQVAQQFLLLQQQAQQPQPVAP